MITLLAIIVTQIIIESLPISSSSHVRAVVNFLESYGFASPPHYIIPYMCDLLHVPTLIIFALFFYDRWQPIFAQLIHGSFNIHILYIACASAVTVLWYLFFSHVWDKQQFPTWCGLLITSALLGSSLFLNTQKMNASFSWRIALLLGCVQGIALLPGISRLGATIIFGCWLGLPAQNAFAASVAMQAPLILAAAIRSVFYLLKWGFLGQFLYPTTILVMVISTIGGYFGLWLTYALTIQTMLWVFAPYVLLFALFFL